MLTWTPGRAAMDLKIMMKILLPLVIWLTELITWIHCKGGPGFGIKREIFFLNLEDGYFGCQVNQSTDVLQLYELSRLCDGHQDCYQGSDELARELKCTSNCISETTSLACQNGACIDSQCHCNDGYGGCSCEVPDENECKYRPCDVFAHCTNTLGSFHCSCFPGYAGDGFHCQDINECEDPAITTRCVQNAECCNLPAHFLCKCKLGFEGDGEFECRDINECLQPNICGANSVCQNTLGNYTCECKEGYRGNPVYGCTDVDECATNLCAPGALCTNFDGGFRCECPPGTTGNAYKDACQDVNECALNPCGVNALCKNTPGSFQCNCPSGYIGDPFHQCTDVDECHSSPCGVNALCNNLNGTFSCLCPEGYTGQPNENCYDVNECSSEPNLCGINAKCVNTPGSYTCVCPAGFSGSPKIYCENVNECALNPCGKQARCTDSIGSYICTCREDYTGDPYKGCEDIDECSLFDKPCGLNAKCENTEPGFTCLCPQGYSGKPDPKVACEQVDVSVLCTSNSECTANAECVDGQCFCKAGFKADRSICLDIDECENHPCGEYSTCLNTPGSFHCGCQAGFFGAPPRMQCKAPCDDVKCGDHAFCKTDGQGAYCMCEEGWSYMPDNIPAGCIDINECNRTDSPCGTNANCVNTPGAFSCQCKLGFTGNAFKGCIDPCEDVKCGPRAYCKSDAQEALCICEDGWTYVPGDIAAGCVDINECDLKTDETGGCGANSICINKPGSFSCRCKAGFKGDPYKECTPSCKKDLECEVGEKCIRGQCSNPCLIEGACGLNAKCRMLNGNKICTCPAGFTGNQAVECVRMAVSCDENSDCGKNHICQDNLCVPKCQTDRECAANEKCLKNTCILSCSSSNDCFLSRKCVNNSCISECSSNDDCGIYEACKNSNCINPCLVSPCGPNAACTVANQRAICSCLVGFVPNPVPKVGCARTPAHPCIENRGCNAGYMCVEEVCRPVCTTDVVCLGNEKCDPSIGICKSMCQRDEDCNHREICDRMTCNSGCRNSSVCSNNRACINNRCVDPCSSPSTCGVNAVCTVINHQKQCQCASPLEGDPFIRCRSPFIKCTNKKDCPAGTACYASSCHDTCRTDYDCLTDEFCVGNICKMSCTSDSNCNDGEICENQLCTSGCRSHFACPDNQACMEGLCKNPCNGTSLCGTCAECRVGNHKAECVCPANYIGDPMINCAKPVQRCDGSCPCDLELGYCKTKCFSNNDCSCGEICKSGKCVVRCNANSACPLGYICKSGICAVGCKHDKDCPLDFSCMNGKCKDPCSRPQFPCGKNANCKVVNHVASCMCSDGYQGNPEVECVRYECTSDSDCEQSMKCSLDKVCRRNPCSESSACGLNANCTVVNSNVHCLCPDGFYGNAYIECKPNKETCQNNPCGDNTQCRDTGGGFECSCLPGCTGDPVRGCLCEGQQKNDYCKNTVCGTNAICRLQNNGDPQCICPFEFPLGDPNIYCKANSLPADCRTDGCGKGALCSKEGSLYKCICPSGTNGNPETECIPGGGEPLLGTSCDHCPAGIPCDPVTGVCAGGKAPETLRNPQPCHMDTDCPETKACFSGLCTELCDVTNLICAPTAQCHAVKHRPVCTCPPGYQGNPAINCYLPKSFPCLSDVECPDNQICLQGSCQLSCSAHNPCAQNAVCINTAQGPECSCIEGFQGNGFVGCVPALPTYQPVCQYNEDCPPDKLCDRLNRRCINPCYGEPCGENADCVPNNHAADCRCAPGSYGNPHLSCTPVTGCNHDEECNANEACVLGKCSNPCHCGPNAICDVLFHRASCKCLPGYTGNPNQGCERPKNPCDPNPCGMHAFCELDNGNPICFCPKGMTGNPFKQCIPEGDDCHPNPCGANTGCRVVQGSAVCFCLSEFVGEPPITPCRLPENPCHPSPCGPNTQCSLLNDGFAKCTCLPGYVESPNTIRGCVEKRNPCDPNPCGYGAICDPNRTPCCFCPENTVGNPYKYCGEPVRTLCQPGPCGRNTDCYITGNTEQCFCKSGYQGDPYIDCQLLPVNPCYPDPCGPLSTCTVSHDGHPTCACPPGILLDSNGGCTGFECTIDEDCPFNKACVRYRCYDPCPGSCGIEASCRVEKHHPVCTCNHGLTGNPLIRCARIESHPVHNPCMPYPCGPNTYCKISGIRAFCTCAENFGGDPKKGCKPECTLNTDCASDQVCINYKCKNPCGINNVCGLGAVCVCRDHMPTCICKEGFTGNPFLQCLPKFEYPSYPNTTLPCTPNPCDPSTQCQVYSGHVAMCDPCYGPTGHYNPSCIPECLYNTDCPFNLACLSEKCLDPCPGSCGIHAHCTVVHHAPVCSCPKGLIGNPFEHCSPVTHPEPVNLCHQGKCGANALCKNTQGHITCECSRGYYGDPYLVCHPECVINTDCPQIKACLNNKCVDPCHGVCGINANCQVINHRPICFCPQEYTGNALVSCYSIREYLPSTPIGQHGNPCDPSPCGPNSRCLISPQGYATCSCVPGYRGSPPLCKPECVVSSECPLTLICINQKCVDPCYSTCGVGANCYVVNHNPICNCPTGHVGDPFVMCIIPPADAYPNTPSNPCEPTPCGPNSVCQVREGHPLCSCLADFMGSPPYCRPECIMNSECPFDKACINEKCRNPCTQACGLNAKCDVVNHAPYCTCLPGYEGDAFISCSKKPATVSPLVPIDPCNPSPCGENAQCSIHDGALRCTCIPPYIGNPYNGACRPECVMSSDCPPNAACLSSHCRDPCPGVCGINAECTVVNHIPSCSCFSDHIGDPFQSCRRKPITPPVLINPCDPSPCGPNSICHVSHGQAVCSCKINFVGQPPNCRPECVVSAECNSYLACIAQKCSDPCPGTCGLHARCTVINHNPICSCPPNTVGDPFTRCVPEAPREPTIAYNPCERSPCGVNSECKIMDNRSVCSCLPGMLGTPPYCRPECLIHADCPSILACLNNKCRNPCIQSCGLNAHCTVVNHQPMCACIEGYHGDPISSCSEATLRQPLIRDPCFPSPCGPNTECMNKNEVAACRCLPGFFGDPYSDCNHECESNSDCGLLLACIGYKCVDPCPGTCGADAICTTVNHIPICSCPSEYTGDPFFSCRPMPLTPKPPTKDPCYPSPCGPNSQCRQVNEQAVCSCLANYVGIPPNCRPECVVSSECPLDKACINQKCDDPCPNTCGLHAICNVRNHKPFCSCPLQFTGNPFSQCTPISTSPLPATTEPPATCVPSPCGPNSLCKIISNSPVCYCLPDFIGFPPSCRPECIISSECPSQFACINQHCRDPCPGSCGVNANCHVLSHVPICICNEGHTGDPFSLCSPTTINTPAPVNPCHPSPCGPNAICHGEGVCECLPEYAGNPYEICRPECVISGECPRDKTCIRYKCQNPCIGTCGQNANCDVINHIPVCSCPPEMTGDPFLLCRLKPADVPIPLEPCTPSPCGPNSICRNNNGQAVCSCLPEYQGSPPSCRPECIVSEECPTMQTCLNKKCVNPCVGVCGYGAQCEVIHHSPICSCREGQTGNPFRSCYNIPILQEPPQPSINPCIPSPCGPNSQCQAINNQPSCSCLQGFVTFPPNCRPECVVNSDCPRNLACINNKCKDPCPGSCGLNSQCQIISNTVSCSCQSGYTGNPFEQCVLRSQEEEPINPCEPSPCGTNAVCKQQNNAGSCTCIPGYLGNPYEGCRPECVLSADCPSNKACVHNKCQDPCPGICGQYATCTVISHIPNCYCDTGYIGDPFAGCHQQSTVDVPPLVSNPCVPSPCGPNSKCVEHNGQAACSCLFDYQGSPPDCRPECVVNDECPTNHACHKYKCNDPCPGTCGINSRCEVIHHRPMCSCPSGYTGDPFQRCYLAVSEPMPPSPPPYPCVPSPCGPYSECRIIGNQPSCSCRESYIGLPPNCRPQCVVNTDCAPTLACISEKCRDPCPGSCGLNAQCLVHNHISTCTCIPQYTGDPFTQCSQILIYNEPPPEHDPCHPSPCGANALCNNGQCFCISNYFGDPYTGCRPECTMNSDCSRNKACINQHCVHPCPGVCGQDARCDVVNHIPKCSCPPQTTGDAFVACRPIVHVDVDLCNPSPCGPNSICRVNDGHAVCSCQPGLIGTPPTCRPECIVSAECDLTLACLSSKCQDPCPGTCGLNAKCNVINHNPICSCLSGYKGDPFRHCHIVSAPPLEQFKPINPCIPSPCGPNSVCQLYGDTPACSCLQNYIGSPPNCRPECTINPECPPNLACINQRCVDPCTGSCGFNAVCSVINHLASCTCIQGYNGDPFSTCVVTSAHLPPTSHPVDPCYPSPCGPNAHCHSEISVGVCQCLPEYQGNPYEGCRPECLISSDCIMSKACIHNKCQDPCPGTCGLSAICSVSNHIPICFCPEGTTGDSFRACERIPREPVSVTLCSPSPCGPNTNCHVVNNVVVCECVPGFEGSPSTSGCHPECVINADCARNKACVNSKCINPCPGVCGYKAICQTLNHSPICSCSPPLVGDPFVECEESAVLVVPIDPCNPSPCGENGHCRVIGGVASCTYPECIINQDCPRDKACYNQRCKDSCVGACGLNAICQVVNHGAVCSCPPGYHGEPKLQCKQEIAIDKPPPECTTNQDCPSNRACLNQACKDPCRESSNVCAANADCRVQQHRPYCFCRYGLTGNAHSYCNEVGCRVDTDCEPAQACVNMQCIDPCSYTQCGQNALCHVDYNNHKSRCYCPETYFGNPLVSCERPQCLSDSDCPLDLACVNQMCQSPCTCALNAICTVQSHVPHCRCPPGHTGNPYEHCIVAPVEIPVECKQDADCSSKLACFTGTCRNPCIETKPCRANADCSVVDTLPLRTMTCLCLPGYVGDADFFCRKEQAPLVPGCQGNDECPFTDICVNRKCVDPCVVHNPCAPNANCQSASHKASCKCPAGLIGDPFANCYQVPHDLPECTIDSDCPSTRACINEKCQEPCAITNPCGIFAECNTLQHRPVCNCPDGWAGRPEEHCYKPECKSDSDCLYDKACRNDNCISPCAVMSCGINARCTVQGHIPHCVCPPGTQGNPLLSCVTVGCQYNEDCADYEACDRLNKKCRPVCEPETCAERATCTPKQHQPVCSCLPGTHGNPYSQCSDSRTPSPECVKDSECPSQNACINSRCENPCRQTGLCLPDQECRVQDTYPVRTVMCVCPADSVATNDGHCKAIVSVECKLDADCHESTRCVRGSCIEACKIDPCGQNALCIAQSHRSACSCPPHYVGNPHVECTNVAIVPLPPTIPECTRDDDCLLNLGCGNQKCVSPCLLENSCGRGSFCHVQDHKPICRCPEGYQGNPLVECIPSADTQVVGCISNSDCVPNESCINRRCVSPCSCGPYAECRVIEHYPMCYCQSGYTGNPQIGCVKAGCESDEHCPFDKTCYNGNCISPCIAGNPCAVSAECYGDNHRAACKCPPTYQGDPFMRCDQVECQIDADCTQDRMCMGERCVNPCDNTYNPTCAPNAICYVRNHAIGCRCPDYLPVGNPLSYCERTLQPNVPVPVCKTDADCPAQHACLKENCVNPCTALAPCSPTARCNVLDSVPLKTLICTCSEGWILSKEGECKPISLPSPPGCESSIDCPINETCINRQCRNPCNCGLNTECFVQNHRPICSCKSGYEGNPNTACKLIGCRRDSECDNGRACINGDCVNPCIVKNPCGANAECFVRGNTAQCHCVSGYRGNPYERCYVVGCRTNNDCPDDRSCINAQCINPCVYDDPCAADAHCRVRNHLALCRCPPGTNGNPYTFCREERRPECREDGDCKQQFACLNNKCRNPCFTLEPCHKPSTCEVVNTLPVRTMVCVCPSGYISDGSATCKVMSAVTDVACTTDRQCPSDRACVNGVCVNPCNCGSHAECHVKNNKPICACVSGYEGNPNIECVAAGCRSDSDCSGQHVCRNRSCAAACAADGSSCGTDAICYGIHHRVVCECPPGLVGNPQIACSLAGCKSDGECPIDRSCVNRKCVNPCAENKDCADLTVCVPFNHKADCSCPPGYVSNATIGCEPVKAGCRSDSECPSKQACINEKCINPCTVTEPCGKDAICTVFDTTPVKTIICECLPGYEGNAVVACVPIPQCAIEKGYVKDEHGNCVCPSGSALNHDDECRRCVPELGYKIDESGHCVCALERGLVIDERGQCVCPPEHGYRLDYFGNCVPAPPSGCESDDDCSVNLSCVNHKCVNPCENKRCGEGALCNLTGHKAVCVCPPNTSGNPEIVCKTFIRKEFTQPEMAVSCLSDGVQVRMVITESGFNGILYVKGHSKEEECRQLISVPDDTPTRVEIFKVMFGACGLIHINGQSSFVLVIQKHPKLVTYKAQAYHIKCVYATSEQNITIGFNVSMLTTAGTIANTGPPPRCVMKIVTRTGLEINSAEIGENLMLQVEVEPTNIYGGFARSCVAKTLDNNVENEYIVTDENGCATEPGIFGEWQFNPDSQSLTAEFNAFKFPTSDNIRFQCNIRVCFGRCQPVNCRGYDAFGKRRKRNISNGTVDIDTSHGGQLREEITIESNAIFTIERHEERLGNPTEEPQTAKSDDICISVIGLIVALILTALLALVAVAVSVSCWLMAYRRPASAASAGPLYHPSGFPNPIFSQSNH